MKHIENEILLHWPFIAETIWTYMDGKIQGRTLSTNRNSFFSKVLYTSTLHECDFY